ncbi:hypothetical protein Zm00014a_020275 [Zea mays]|uniref:Uncharacterized protein n=1 Tax=Zea mays TaxID=4577 RepID=A0A3L6F1M1_MAIZE|nr:hypothetical protein Zm00014a_020275 [Zea mays]
MSAMAAAPPPAPHLDSVLSFSALASHAAAEPASSDSDSDSDSDLEFAFAPPPLSPRAGAHALAPADDLFAHGRIVPAYPLAGHGHDEALASSPAPTSSSAAAPPPPPSPDTYCAWAPRDAPAAFPKSASTGTEARRSWRLRDLVAAGGGRSRSDGKEKFAFLQPSSSASPAAPSKPSGGDGDGSKHASAKAAAPPQKQAGKKDNNKKKKKKGGATEMDMATAHRLFYGKPGAAALAGDRTRQPQQQSYLPYRPGIVGFFVTAHALGRSHHPY